MTTTVTPDIEQDSTGSQEWPTLGPDLADTTREDCGDPTPGRTIGLDPYGDPTQGRKLGADPYDDPTQGRKLGSDPYDDPTRARPRPRGPERS